MEIMRKVLLIIVLLLLLAVPLYADNEITRNVDEFTGLEMVTFKKPLKFARRLYMIDSESKAWLTPVVAKKPDGSIDWMQWHFTRRNFFPLRISREWKSTLKLRLNGKDVIEFKAINDFSEMSVTRGEYSEYAMFDLTQDQLQAIAEASEVKARVSGWNGKYIDIPRKQYKIHQDWLEGIRMFYAEVVESRTDTGEAETIKLFPSDASPKN